jgi:hypothetical protein
MKKIIYSFLVLFVIVISCTKEKTPVEIAPVEFLTTECPDTVKFIVDILPIFNDNSCFSCHSMTQPNLSDHSNISSNATQILKALKGDGAQLMPQGGPALSPAKIQQFECWVNQGKLNN